MALGLMALDIASVVLAVQLASRVSSTRSAGEVLPVVYPHAKQSISVASINHIAHGTILQQHQWRTDDYLRARVLPWRHLRSRWLIFPAVAATFTLLCLSAGMHDRLEAFLPRKGT
jgi:hypothetical protein